MIKNFSPNLGNPNADPTNAADGTITGQDSKTFGSSKTEKRKGIGVECY